MKLIIAGGRDFKDYFLLERTLLYILSLTNEEVEIVSGTANGADKLGEDFASNFNYPIKRFPADWDKFGKSAGYIRNKQMAEYATHCICFWDGKSAGTKLMIELAKQNNLPTRVVTY